MSLRTTPGGLHEALLHELCNRATPLLALAERLRELPLPAEHRPLLSALYRSSRDVERLLRSLRDPDDFFVPRPTDVDVRTLCADLCDALKADARGGRVRLCFEPGPPVQARADELQVAEIVVNLLRNAIEATGPGGHVLLTFSATGRVVRISVRDNGPGIPPSIREDLFRWRASTKAAGRGIGLALSRALARAQGGRLLHRRRDGETEFLLLLRRARPAPPRALERPRVLVVEDDPEVRLALESALSDSFEVTAVADGEEALRALETAEFTAMLVDAHLPRGPEGQILASEACRLQPALRGNVVLVTGDGRASETDGGARVLRKPFDGASLRRALWQGIERSGADARG